MPIECAICYEELDEDSTPSLDGCEHKFHQQCIVRWFRAGNKKCPLCNNLGIDTTDMMNRVKVKTIQEIKKLGRRKACPPDLKKTIGLLRDNERQAKEAKRDIADFKKLHKELYKQHRTLSNKRFKLWQKNWKLEDTLLAQIAVQPVYIYQATRASNTLNNT